jgi:hypothetical protein
MFKRKHQATPTGTIEREEGGASNTPLSVTATLCESKKPVVIKD